MHVVLLLFQPLLDVGTQNLGMWGMCNLVKAYRNVQNPLPITESRTGKPAMVTLTIQLKLFHGPWHDPVGQRICAEPFWMWNRCRFHPFLQVSQIFHFWPKFGDSSLNKWWVIAQTCSLLPHTWTDTQTDRRTQRQYPKAITGLG